MDIRNVDLNLLRVFDALMQDANLTRAGFRLGLSQPSMSHALARLRKISGDPLFVRIPSGMEPTPFSQQIASAVRDGLALLQGALDGTAAFSSATCNRTFQILMSDIGELVYLPRLITKLAVTAPEVNLRVLQLPREAYHDAFISGEADLPLAFCQRSRQGFTSSGFSTILISALQEKVTPASVKSYRLNNSPWSRISWWNRQDRAIARLQCSLRRRHSSSATWPARA